MSRSVGIREVAERAGVSIGTVSNALNRPDLVSAPKRAAIRDAISDLGFVRNDLARKLRWGDSTTLAMIVLNVANPFFADLAHATEEEAEKRNYTVILGSSDQLVERESRYIDLFEEQRVHGLLIAPVEGASERLDALRRRGTPTVLFGAFADNIDYCTVGLDGDAGGFLAVQHLIDGGRRDIAFLGGPLSQVQDRWNGAMRACALTSGAKIRHVDSVDQTMSEGRAVAESILRLPLEQRPDAIFAANDQLALGAMQALVMDESVDFPSGIALIGFDDSEYSASAIIPLSTIRQPRNALASAAIDLIVDEVDELNNAQHHHRRVLLPPELIVRGTTPARK